MPLSYKKIGQSIGKLVEEKQKAYGDSFGKSGECLRQLYPNGIKPTQYDDLLTIARMLDKIFRIATDPDAFGENPYKDLGGYSLLGYARYQKRNKKANTKSRQSKGPRGKPKRIQSAKGKVPSTRRRRKHGRRS